MKKYIVYNTNQGRKDGLMYSGLDADDALECILDIIETHNAKCTSDKDKVNIFDYTFATEEIKPKDIVDFKSAREYLGGKPNMDYTVTQKLGSSNTLKLADVSRLVRDLNPSWVETLIALNELFSLAQAWRRAFSKQDHHGADYTLRLWQPTFEYTESGFRCTGASDTTTQNFFVRGLLFPTKGCATAFGHKFIHLFKKVIR